LRKATPEESIEIYKTYEIGGRWANVKALLAPESLLVIAIGICAQGLLIALFAGH
jgi:hypothetical protein